MSQLIDRLIRHAEERPDATAVLDPGRLGSGQETSWSQLRSMACAAQGLAREAPAGAILVSSRNRTETLAAYLGCLWAGRWILALPPDSSASEVAQAVAAANVSTAIAEQDVFPKVPQSVATRIPIESLAHGESANTATPHGNGAILLQSSGTTGAPKVVVRETGALDSLGDSLAGTLRLGPGDRMLITIPLYHSYGIDMALLCTVFAGCTIELHKRFSPAAAHAALVQRGITFWPAVPVMLDSLSRSNPSGGAANRLTQVVSAGSPLSPPIAQRFLERYGIPVGQIYGASEFGSVTHHEGLPPSSTAHCVGRAMKGVRIRILSDDDPDLDHPLPCGSEGEVAVASSSMMSGYVDGSPWALPSGDASESFLRTGDTGYLDSDGRLHLTGRTKLFIDVGAQKVNPIEVERVLSLFPGVREVVVVPMPFSETAERVKAIVLPEADASLDVEDLRVFARHELSAFKVPRVFEVRDELPRTPTGKVIRSALQTTKQTGRST